MPDAPSDQPPSALRSRVAVARFAVLFAVLLAADLGLKTWSFATVPPEGIPLIPKVLSLHLTENPGAIFGTLRGRKTFFIVASIVAAAMILYFFSQSRSREWGTHVGLAMILAGAMGNLYDRLAFGFVRDMLHLFPGVKLPWGLRWWGGSDELYPWIFNLADVYLLIGIGVILIKSLAAPDEDRSSQATDRRTDPTDAQPR